GFHGFATCNLVARRSNYAPHSPTILVGDLHWASTGHHKSASPRASLVPPPRRYSPQGAPPPLWKPLPANGLPIAPEAQFPASRLTTQRKKFREAPQRVRRLHLVVRGGACRVVRGSP